MDIQAGEAIRRGFRLAIWLLAIVLLLTMSMKVWENINPKEILVVQSPWKGQLTWYATAGVKWQGLGTVTQYPKRGFYRFELPVRFYDGGHATMVGSVQYDMPLDPEHLTKIHSKFGSPEAVNDQLIKTITDKCAYLTGPTMTSKESYGEKRNDLIFLVEDQIANGVYKTTSRETKITDPLTGTQKTVTVVEIAKDAAGLPLRQEKSVLADYGIRPFNFAIERLLYDSTVEMQIKQQQEISMGIQTSVAEAKKAEQKTITVTEQGKALAAEAQWKQEAIKAQFVTEARQKLEVATLAAQEAEQYKRAQILRAEGDAEYKRKVMAADGALTQKLDAWVKINGMYADAVKNHAGPWVPSIVMGEATKTGTTAVGVANPLIDLLTAKTALELGLDMTVKKQ